MEVRRDDTFVPHYWAAQSRILYDMKAIYKYWRVALTQMLPYCTHIYSAVYVKRAQAARTYFLPYSILIQHPPLWRKIFWAHLFTDVCLMGKTHHPPLWVKSPTLPYGENPAPSLVGKIVTFVLMYVCLMGKIQHPPLWGKSLTLPYGENPNYPWYKIPVYTFVKQNSLCFVLFTYNSLLIAGFEPPRDSKRFLLLWLISNCN